MSQSGVTDERTAGMSLASFRTRVASLGLAFVLAACAPQLASTTDSPDPYAEAPRPAPVEGPRILPIPPIPVALRGCWDWVPPDDPDEPGSPHRLVITATTVEETGLGLGRRVATAEYVERVTPTFIKGRFAAPDGDGSATVATELGLGDGGDGGPVGVLRRAEGDAGSDYYTRCVR
jgi:hypothetical protein